jgi:hypothetical protein
VWDGRGRNGELNFRRASKVDSKHTVRAAIAL